MFSQTFWWQSWLIEQGSCRRTLHRSQMEPQVTQPRHPSLPLRKLHPVWTACGKSCNMHMSYVMSTQKCWPIPYMWYLSCGRYTLTDLQTNQQKVLGIHKATCRRSGASNHFSNSHAMEWAPLVPMLPSAHCALSALFVLYVSASGSLDQLQTPYGTCFTSYHSQLGYWSGAALGYVQAATSTRLTYPWQA